MGTLVLLGFVCRFSQDLVLAQGRCPEREEGVVGVVWCVCVCDGKNGNPRPSWLSPENDEFPIVTKNRAPGALPHLNPGVPLTSWPTWGHR